MKATTDTIIQIIPNTTGTMAQYRSKEKGQSYNQIVVAWALMENKDCGNYIEGLDASDMVSFISENDSFEGYAQPEDLD